MFLTLCVREQRSLRKIEAALCSSAPHLVSLLTIFNRLGRGEEMPRRERLPSRPNRLAAALLLSLVLAAGLLALLTNGLSSGRACLPHPVISVSWRGASWPEPSVSITCSGGWAGGLSITHAPASRPGPASSWRRMEQYLYRPGARRPAHESAAGDTGPR